MSKEKPTAVLYFGNDWTAENRTSSHHIARRLGKSHQVFYFECPGLRAPSSSARDVWKILSKLKSALRGGRAVGVDGVVVYTLIQLPFHRLPFARTLNRFLLRSWVKVIASFNRVSHPIAWFTVPHAVPLLGSVNERLSVYYCVDNYAGVPGVDVSTVTAMDEELTRRADCVFVVSPTLLTAKQKANANVFLSPHGVDLKHFAQAMRPSEPPADLRPLLGRPIVGFIGLIEEYVDLDLIRYAAAATPDWSYVMIGRTAIAIPDGMPRNVHFLGPKPYEALPAYGAQFSVGIIPYRQTTFTAHASPLKLREYLAMGKPVVSTRTPVTEAFADVIKIANTHQEFVASLRQVVDRPERPEDIRRRLDVIRSESWDARVERILEQAESVSRR